ncbi:exodeoxyribonuclease VII small subunit [Candidatus Methanoperedens nitratireducens]|uniref:Exodeoxyribonuclease 7 small subunit n=1 Tax=Candidatus Methanoperedens nitratireducens TaxID=1392998 RepID=A0A284VTK5_9EURY|nr:exodeoxyribonuclease VII small subunit [Candidatus Methanoperedens nitroreducens]SNQ62497.1 Exodeoxyribonuclease 7 small subunit [Candidatus Methanoperedens nitroreducens]
MEMSFEESLVELENIVEKLENGQLSLDESLILFDTGIKLVKECDTKLKNAQQQIEKLIEENNCLKSEPFELHNENAHEK